MVQLEAQAAELISHDIGGEIGKYKDLEEINSKIKMINESGVFMETFKIILEENNININFYDVDDYL